ncbi:MAG: peptidoglycan DD-metalloendopeptidase family protein [Gammaproteobacteria bacterium]|nr:peptidoglycan DD-metalloendopeptidase family protein [Gammaproteobacteria bacterium]
MKFQDIDFKSDRPVAVKLRKPSPMLPKFQLKILSKAIIASTVIILLGFSASSWQPAAKIANSTPKSARLHYSLALPKSEITLEHEIAKSVEPIDDNDWKIITIESGDTLARIFSAVGLSAATTHAIATLNEHTKSFRTIQPGQKIHILQDDQNRLRMMKYVPDITRTLVIQRNEDQSFSSKIINYKLDAFPIYREGVIKNSLFEAAAEANIPQNIIMEMANIFGWDIDFSLDIRMGDRFGVVYNELYKNGVKIRNGQILAAEFINDGRRYKAVYYTDPQGNGNYFTEDGKSMRKAFLRSPVKFSRISSRFSKKRWHPVLSGWRSHKGVDYAAARGTPIRASGDGKVSFAGNKGGFGRAIFIQHGGRYTTVYGHLNAYAKGVRKGKKVKQGQIIGYVGSSGLATGPHLHYEFRVNGVHRNPLTVRLPEAKPVNPTYRDHFAKNTRAYLSMLQIMGNTLAVNSY